VAECRSLLAVCGLYCEACYHYRAGLPEGRHLLEEASRRGRPVAGYTCQGCRSDQLYVHSGCADCAIRACAERQGLVHCGDCERWPCNRLLVLRGDARLPTLAERGDMGVVQWLTDQAERWRCACGAGFSWYETRCQQCGAALSSYGRDPALPEPAPDDAFVPG
jgi:hypothetical protein